MSTPPATLQSLTDSLLSKLPPRVAQLLQANARSRLLKKVDVVLMVFDERLYDLSNGAWQSIIEDESDPAQGIAAAAAHLLESREESPSVLLLLPSSWFIATEVNMPGLVGENLRSALHLQSSVLLPGHESPLTFAVDSTPAQTESPQVVLWTDENRVNALFNAFETEKLFLAGVMPRAIAACDPDEHGDCTTQDRDADTLSCVSFRAGLLVRFLQIPVSDLADEAFAKQWREETDTAPDTPTQQYTEPQAYVQRGENIRSDSAYCFIPEGAQRVRQQAEKGRRIGMAVAAGIAVIAIGSLPFFWQSLQIWRLESQLESLRESSFQAREDQAAVREFEQSWGVLNEYPRQNIAASLLQLQSVLSPSVLTSIEIDEGSVEIEGESQDPQSLLQLLEQDSMFTGVDFARATNNNRYYIEFRLSTVDYDSYRQWYFPDERRR